MICYNMGLYYFNNYITDLECWFELADIGDNNIRQR